MAGIITLSNMQEKVVGLEQSLTMLVKEFEEEKQVIQECHTSELEQSRVELVSLQRCYDMQDKEMTHVKQLARRILDQRSDIEVFFLESLAHVRKEIATNRYIYLHAHAQCHVYSTSTCMYVYIARCILYMYNRCMQVYRCMHVLFYIHVNSYVYIRCMHVYADVKV